MPVDEEVESHHLKFIQNVPAGMTFAEAVSRFNSNVSYSGLLHAVTADVCPFASVSHSVCLCLSVCLSLIPQLPWPHLIIDDGLE